MGLSAEIIFNSASASATHCRLSCICGIYCHRASGPGRIRTMVKIDLADLTIKVENNNRKFLTFLQLILHALSVYCMIFYLSLRLLSKLAIVENTLLFGLYTVLFTMCNTQLVKRYTGPCKYENAFLSTLI